jgi:hypothetical protein
VETLTRPRGCFVLIWRFYLPCVTNGQFVAIKFAANALFLKDCFSLDLAPDYEPRTTFLWAVIGQLAKKLSEKSMAKLLEIN